MEQEPLPMKDALPVIIAIVIIAIVLGVVGSWTDKHQSSAIANPNSYKQKQGAR